MGGAIQALHYRIIIIIIRIILRIWLAKPRNSLINFGAPQVGGGLCWRWLASQPAMRRFRTVKNGSVSTHLRHATARGRRLFRISALLMNAEQTL